MQLTSKSPGRRRVALLSAVLAAAAAVAAVGCDSLLTKPSLYNQVEVSTVRRNGEPAPGVSLELYIGARPMGYGVSDAKGQYTFQRVPQGAYGVLATALPDEYEFVEDLIGGRHTNYIDGLNVAGDTTIHLHFTLLRHGPGAITVHVTDVTGTSLAAVPVKLYSGTQTIDQKPTDSAGYVTFANVPFGQYGVVVFRPLFYRDFRTPSDSLYTFRDGLSFEAGATDSVTVSLQRCAGTIRALAQDATTGAPVRDATVTLYSSTQLIALAVTGADGRAALAGPCVTSLGVNVNPPVGYTVAPGRGSSFVDGLSVASGGTADVVFRLQPRQP